MNAWNLCSPNSVARTSRRYVAQMMLSRASTAKIRRSILTEMSAQLISQGSGKLASVPSGGAAAGGAGPAAAAGGATEEAPKAAEKEEEKEESDEDMGFGLFD